MSKTAIVLQSRRLEVYKLYYIQLLGRLITQSLPLSIFFSGYSFKAIALFNFSSLAYYTWQSIVFTNPITIEAGSTVTWTNVDNFIHTVTSGEANSVKAGELFDSGLTAFITASKSFSHKFMHSGEFSYFCRVHPTMVGNVNVLP
jgi:Copper binding proteins, plastocyanin/azurin family